jgi:catalase
MMEFLIENTTDPNRISFLVTGVYPKWRFCVQVMPEEDAEKTLYNPFDRPKSGRTGTIR